MSIFTQPFLSVAGQKERLSNVANTLLSSVTGKGVTANTKNTTVNKVLEFAGSNPYTTALAVTPVNTAKAVATGFKALPVAGKVVAGVSAPIVASAVITNPTIVKKVAETPKTLSQVGSISSFEDALGFAKEHPIVTGGALTGGALLVGKGVSSTLATIANTSAVKKNTEVATSSALTTIPQYIDTYVPTKPNTKSVAEYSPVPATPSVNNNIPSEVMTRSYTNVNTRTKVKHKRKTLNTTPINLRNTINIFNKN